MGPVAASIGRVETLWLSLGIMLVTWLGILLLPSVWAIGRQEPELQPTTIAA
jgi:hypothetical protein